MDSQKETKRKMRVLRLSRWWWSLLGCNAM